MDLRKTSVEFEGTEAPFFRIELTDARPHPEAESIKLAYEGLELFAQEAGKKDLRVRSVKSKAAVPEVHKPLYDSKQYVNPASVVDRDGNTVITLAPALPVRLIAFKVRNHFYYRTIRIYGSETGKDDSYLPLASQALYRFPFSPGKNEEKNEVDLAMPQYAYYRIMILNKGSRPLDIKAITLSWIRKSLFFIAPAAGRQYSLCFGNPQMAAPEYNISRSVNNYTLARLSFETAALAPPVRTESAAHTIRQRISIITRYAPGIAIAFLVVWIGSKWLAASRKGPGKSNGV